MELCNSCDIVFLGRKCPLCVANETISELEKEIESMRDEIIELGERATLN